MQIGRIRDAFVSPNFAPKRPRNSAFQGQFRQCGSGLSIWALFWQAGWVVKLVMIGLLAPRSGPGRSSSTRSIAYGRMRARAEPLRAGVLVRPVAGGALPHAVRAPDDRHGRDLRRGHARVEEELREGRALAARPADRIDKAMDVALTREMERAGRPARLPRDHRLGGALHRPVRHGRRHHDLVPGHRRLEATNLAVVAPGIAEALLATAIGLLAAIPAVIAYNKLSGRRQAAVRMEGFADEFSAILSRQIDERSRRRR
jgi:biopolymer transport protein TolQ